MRSTESSTRQSVGADPPGPYKILFNTADPNPTGAAYGGGTGGYGRWVSVILNTFASPDFELVPCFQSARRGGRFYRLAFPYRLFSDLVRLGRGARDADAIHMTLQYRSATPREFLSVVLARVLRVPVLADIRAGQYVSWYRGANFFYRWMARYVVRHAAAVAVEGESYGPFLRDELGVASTYCPMIVADSEIPRQIPQRCAGAELKVLFVGYCYDGKGVKELATGAREAAAAGHRIRLTLVGEEHEEFTAWMDAFDPGSLVIARLGRLPHLEAIDLMLDHDVFGMPTRHAGEGHPNVINEAMMTGMVIVCTRHGFLESVLPEDGCYFLEDGSPQSVARALERIAAEPEEARRRAACAHERLRTRYTSGAVLPLLESMYRRLVGAE